MLSAGTQTQQKSVQRKVQSKRPHPTERPRSSSTSSDTKSEPEGYLASESSESLDCEDRKTQVKQKYCRKEKLLARPIGSTDTDSYDSKEERPNTPQHTLVATATEPAPYVPVNQVGPKCNIKLCSGDEYRSSSDGDYVQPCQVQEYVSIY